MSFGSNFHIYSDFRSSLDGKYNEVTAFCTRRNEIFWAAGFNRVVNLGGVGDSGIIFRIVLFEGFIGRHRHRYAKLGDTCRFMAAAGGHILCKRTAHKA